MYETNQLAAESLGEKQCRKKYPDPVYISCADVGGGGIVMNSCAVTGAAALLDRGVCTPRGRGSCAALCLG